MRFGSVLKLAGLVAVLAVGMSTLGLAQGRQGAPQGRDGGDRLMVKAARQSHEAVRVMNGALPIYHGHRVKAIELTKMAIEEIRIGLIWDKNHDDPAAAGQNLEQKLNRIRNLDEKGGRFSDEQIRRSNQMMRKAGDILVQVKTDLLAAPKDYGGHRATAIRLVNMAIEEVKLALQGDGPPRP
jgi:hypothetical protein